MNIVELCKEEPFSTFEAAKLLGMGDHKDQVVAWVRRHIKIYSINKTNLKKNIFKLDLVNIFELALIKMLSEFGIKLNSPWKAIDRKWTEGMILDNEESDYWLAYDRKGYFSAWEVGDKTKKITFPKPPDNKDIILIIRFGKCKKGIMDAVKKMRNGFENEIEYE